MKDTNNTSKLIIIQKINYFFSWQNDTGLEGSTGRLTVQKCMPDDERIPVLIMKASRPKPKSHDTPTGKTSLSFSEEPSVFSVGRRKRLRVVGEA